MVLSLLIYSDPQKWPKIVDFSTKFSITSFHEIILISNFDQCLNTSKKTRIQKIFEKYLKIGSVGEIYIELEKWPLLRPREIIENIFA